MTTLSSLLPPFLRRKRSAEEDEAHALRAALHAAGRATAVEKCVELRAANKALAQRIGELERAVAASRDDAVVRVAVRDEVARLVPLPPPFCAAGDSVATSDSDDSAWEGADEGSLTESETPSSTPPPLARADSIHLLGLSPAELRSYCDDNRISSVIAISGHEPEFAAWRKEASPLGKRSERVDEDDSKFGLAVFNLRQAPIDVLWIDYNGIDKSFSNSKVAPGQDARFTTSSHHFWRVYDVADHTLLGAAYITLPKPPLLFDGWTWRPEPAKQLRTLFGFDGFIGPSLGEAMTALHKAAEVRVTLAMTPALKEHHVVVVV